MDFDNLDTVLTALGVTAPNAQDVASSPREYMARLDGLLALAAGERVRLGELLQAAAHVTKDQLEEALAEQRRDGRMLGEILVERSHLTAHERDVLLEFQRRQAGLSPTSGELCLGNILVATGQITRQQLIDALKWQAEKGGRLGAALVACGHATEHQIQRGLSLQAKLVAAVLIAALALASGAGLQNAYAGPATTQIRVVAQVGAFFRTRVESQASALAISQADIARGYVDVPEGSSFTVTTNIREGYLIEFTTRADVFRSVTVTGLRHPVEIGAQGGVAPYDGPHGSTMFHQLSYRFMLRPDLQPGNYPWPLQISVRTA